MTRVAILNSRQSKTPICKDQWVINTMAAVSHSVMIKDWGVVSSAGMFTWDLLTWDVGRAGGNLELVVPKAKEDGEDRIKRAIITDFALDPNRVRWHFIDVAASEVTTKKWWLRRDRMVIELADIVLPVSLRRDGQLRKLISSGEFSARFDHRFDTIVYHPPSHHLPTLVEGERLTDAVRNWESDFLIHWTRARHGPWPGETKAAFFEDFVEWSDDYCRSGFKTLLRILRERLIRASSWKTGGKRPMVAFTQLSALESIPLMRWRPRWARWSFEPYGIAVHRDWAQAKGIRPVRYVASDQWRKLAAEEKPFSHSMGKADPIWPAEREWRCMGDLNLGNAPQEALRVIVREEAEITAVREVIDVPVYAFMR